MTAQVVMSFADYKQRDAILEGLFNSMYLPPKYRSADGKDPDIKAPDGFFPKKDREPGYEVWPPNIREIEPHAFYHYLVMYLQPIKDVRNHLPNRPGEKLMFSDYWTAILYYTEHGDGFGVAYKTKPKTPRGTQTFTKYFQFGVCVHEWKSRNIGRCYNKYYCEKCGTDYTIDSSD